MTILVGHEKSQVLTKALRANGHNAFSSDLQPCEGGHPEWHMQMDVFRAIGMGVWDAALFFPDCTYLTTAAEWAYGDGPYHMEILPGTLVGAARRQARKEAADHVKALWNCRIPRIAIENPVGCLSRVWRKPNQVIQPYRFGEDASKKTCLWLRGFPELKPTQYIEPRIVNGKKRWANQTDGGQNRLTPSQGRAYERAITYPGIAKAIADQWFPSITHNGDTRTDGMLSVSDSRTVNS